jgi:hypothetical protein
LTLLTTGLFATVNFINLLSSHEKNRKKRLNLKHLGETIIQRPIVLLDLQQKAFKEVAEQHGENFFHYQFYVHFMAFLERAARYPQKDSTTTTLHVRLIIFFVHASHSCAVFIII